LSFNQSFDIQHRVTLFPQPTDMTCWSAATTMLFGSNFSAGPGQAQLAENSGIYAREANIQAFARDWGLHIYWPQTWTVPGLVEVLRRGPAAMLGRMPQSHVVVIAGIRGDGTPTGTDLTIYDPHPTNIGTILHANFHALVTRLPMSTMYLLQR
jgi:hypothetical protein